MWEVFLLHFVFVSMYVFVIIVIIINIIINNSDNNNNKKMHLFVPC